MALPAPRAGDWRDRIEEKAALFRHAVISVFDPNQSGLVALVSRRAARIQQNTSPAIAKDAGEHLAKRTFLMEIHLSPMDPPLPAGSVVRVHSCQRDPNLELYAFTVTNSVNSSEAALRTIQTSTDLAVLERLP